MNRRALDKLKRELLSQRRSQKKARDLESLARRLGRKNVGGTHPMWVSTVFPSLRPLSIPHHGGKDIPAGTRNSILDQLDDDIAAWEEEIEGHEYDDRDDGETNGSS